MEGWAVWPARLYLRSVQQTTESECFVWEFGDCASRYALLVDRLSESEPALRLNLCSGLGVGIFLGCMMSTQASTLRPLQLRQSTPKPLRCFSCVTPCSSLTSVSTMLIELFRAWSSDIPNIGAFIKIGFSGPFYSTYIKEPPK